jgi:hypothetical protein
VAKLVYTLNSASAGQILNGFASFIGHGDLNSQLTRVSKKLRERSVVSADAEARYAIPIGLMNLYGRQISAPPVQPIANVRHGYQALSFAAVAVQLRRHLTIRGRNVLRGRITAALKPIGDARALAHEFRVITTLAQNDWDVEFMDFEGRAQYDFIARKGDKEVEIECKTVTADCGNAIHREDFENFGGDLLRKLKSLKLEDVMVRIDVGLADRLPKKAAAREEIAKAISALLSGPVTSALVDGSNITLRRLKKSPIDPADIRGSALRALAPIRKEQNGAVVGIFSLKSFIAIHIFSARRSKVQDSIRETIESGSEQLSTSNPAIIWTHFVDLTNAELNSLIQIYKGGTFTLLEGIAYKMFNEVKHDHVAALFFSGEAAIRNFGGPGSLIIHSPYYTQRGTLYPLWNKNCRLNNPFRELM